MRQIIHQKYKRNMHKKIIILITESASISWLLHDMKSRLDKHLPLNVVAIYLLIFHI